MLSRIDLFYEIIIPLLYTSFFGLWFTVVGIRFFRKPSREKEKKNLDWPMLIILRAEANKKNENIDVRYWATMFLLGGFFMGIIWVKKIIELYNYLFS